MAATAAPTAPSFPVTTSWAPPSPPSFINSNGTTPPHLPVAPPPPPSSSAPATVVEDLLLLLDSDSGSNGNAGASVVFVSGRRATWLQCRWTSHPACSVVVNATETCTQIVGTGEDSESLPTAFLVQVPVYDVNGSLVWNAIPMVYRQTPFPAQVGGGGLCDVEFFAGEPDILWSDPTGQLPYELSETSNISALRLLVADLCPATNGMPPFDGIFRFDVSGFGYSSLASTDESACSRGLPLPAPPMRTSTVHWVIWNVDPARESAGLTTVPTMTILENGTRPEVQWPSTASRWIWVPTVGIPRELYASGAPSTTTLAATSLPTAVWYYSPVDSLPALPSFVVSGVTFCGQQLTSPVDAVNAYTSSVGMARVSTRTKCLGLPFWQLYGLTKWMNVTCPGINLDQMSRAGVGMVLPFQCFLSSSIWNSSTESNSTNNLATSRRLSTLPRIYFDLGGTVGISSLQPSTGASSSLSVSLGTLVRPEDGALCLGSTGFTNSFVASLSSSTSSSSTSSGVPPEIIFGTDVIRGLSAWAVDSRRRRIGFLPLPSQQFAEVGEDRSVCTPAEVCNEEETFVEQTNSCVNSICPQLFFKSYNPQTRVCSLRGVVVAGAIVALLAIFGAEAYLMTRHMGIGELIRQANEAKERDREALRKQRPLVTMSQS